MGFGKAPITCLFSMNELQAEGEERELNFFVFSFVLLVQGLNRRIKICKVLFTFSWFGYRN